MSAISINPPAPEAPRFVVRENLAGGAIGQHVEPADEDGPGPVAPGVHNLSHATTAHAGGQQQTGQQGQTPPATVPLHAPPPGGLRPPRCVPAPRPPPGAPSRLASAGRLCPSRGRNRTPRPPRRAEPPAGRSRLPSAVPVAGHAPAWSVSSSSKIAWRNATATGPSAAITVGVMVSASGSQNGHAAFSSGLRVR